MLPLPPSSQKFSYFFLKTSQTPLHTPSQKFKQKLAFYPNPSYDIPYIPTNSTPLSLNPTSRNLLHPTIKNYEKSIHHPLPLPLPPGKKSYKIGKIFENFIKENLTFPRYEINQRGFAIPVWNSTSPKKPCKFYENFSKQDQNLRKKSIKSIYLI
ncbi:MAG: hypothetical protein D6805_04905 [Planctomycetota bacterium]|nr:MAG: hypothetical protein D6805_04905 [Planctomycetota bacterium]